MSCLNIIVALIIGLIPLFQWPDNVSPEAKEDSVSLKYVDLAKHPVLLSMVRDAIEEDKRQPSDRVNFFSIYIYMKDGEDSIVRATVRAETVKNLHRTDDFTGYYMIGSMPIIIENTSKYRLLPEPGKERYFPMVLENSPFIYDPNEYFYIIKDDGYARLVWGIGWVWDKPLDSSYVRNEGTYRLTAPKRTSRKRIPKIEP